MRGAEPPDRCDWIQEMISEKVCCLPNLVYIGLHIEVEKYIYLPDPDQLIMDKTPDFLRQAAAQADIEVQCVVKAKTTRYGNKNLFPEHGDSDYE